MPGSGALEQPCSRHPGRLATARREKGERLRPKGSRRSSRARMVGGPITIRVQLLQYLGRFGWRTGDVGGRVSAARAVCNPSSGAVIVR